MTVTVRCSCSCLWLLLLLLLLLLLPLHDIKQVANRHTHVWTAAVSVSVSNFDFDFDSISWTQSQSPSLQRIVGAFCSILCRLLKLATIRLKLQLHLYIYTDVCVAGKTYFHALFKREPFTSATKHKMKYNFQLQSVVVAFAVAVWQKSIKIHSQLICAHLKKLQLKMFFFPTLIHTLANQQHTLF